MTILIFAVLAILLITGFTWSKKNMMRMFWIALSLEFIVAAVLSHSIA